MKIGKKLNKINIVIFFGVSNRSCKIKILTLWTPDDGISTLRKLPYAPDCVIPSKRLVATRAGRRYTCDTVHSPSAPTDGIQSLFSNAYRHFRVIEIQTTQQLKNNCFREIQRIYMNKFYIWTPSGQRTS